MFQVSLQIMNYRLINYIFKCQKRSLNASLFNITSISIYLFKSNPLFYTHLFHILSTTLSTIQHFPQLLNHHRKISLPIFFIQIFLLIDMLSHDFRQLLYIFQITSGEFLITYRCTVPIFLFVKI